MLGRSSSVAVVTVLVMVTLCINASAQCPPVTVHSGEGEDGFGETVAIIGDVTGDCYDDYAVHLDVGTATGVVRIYSGKTNELLHTIVGGKSFGKTIVPLGDIEGDGYAEFVIGQPYFGESVDYNGKVYAYGYDGLSWDYRWEFTGVIFSKTGSSLACIDDVDGDDFPDIVAGAPDWGPDSPTGFLIGGCYVLSGVDGTQVSYSPIGEPTERNASEFGCAVAAIGDVNGDDVDDFVVGAKNYDAEGRVYVMSGLDGSSIDHVPGLQTGSEFGYSLAGLCDVDGSGNPGFIAGAPKQNTQTGRVYVIRATDLALQGTLSGVSEYDYFGTCLARVGDLDGDGQDEFVVGAPDYTIGDEHYGAVFIYRGSDHGQLFSYYGATQGSASPNKFGYTLASGGDLNDDGTPDLIVGHASDELAYVYHLGDYVIEVSPAQNAVSAARDTDISATFCSDMNWASIDSESFMVYGSYTGRRSGTITVEEQSRTVTFDPDSTFGYGEEVTVILTSSIEASGSDPMLTGYCWKFTAAVSQGGGSFGPYVSVESYSEEGRGLAPADFDGDGDIDLAAAVYIYPPTGEGSLSILWNNGAGIFDSDTTYDASDGVIYVGAADLDADGMTDLVACDLGYNVTVMLNDGTGRFPDITQYSTDNEGGMQWAITDFNGDGYLDLVGPGHECFCIIVGINNGDGTFVFQTIGDWVDHCAIAACPADIDSDGDMDLLSCGNTCGHPFFVWRNNGYGDLEPMYISSIVGEAYAVVSGDLNSDGRPDAVLELYGEELLLWNNGCNPLFDQVASYEIFGRERYMELADIDGDIDLDLVTTAGFHTVYPSSIVTMYNSAGLFPDSAKIVTVSTPWNVETCDLNGDGRLDVAVTNYGYSTTVGGVGIHFNQTCHDADGDGWGDPEHPENECPVDNCPTVWNPDQDDTNLDGVGDACTFEENTPIGDDVPVELGPVDLTFDNVSIEGLTELEITVTPPGPEPGGFQIEPAEIPTYYYVETGATYTPPIVICFEYDDTDIEDESQLVLYHWDGSDWGNPLPTISHDTELNIICAETQSLSPFAMATPLGFICGDANGSQAVDIDDVVHLINYIFAGGPAPDPNESGDANCSGDVDIDDVVYLINYIFAGGPDPCDTDDNGAPDC